MPDPNVSGTAYTFFQSLIDTVGEEEAKEYVKNFAGQVGGSNSEWLHASRACCEW